MRIITIFLLLILGLTFQSCRKDSDDITGGPDPVIFVQSTIYGVIKGANDKGLAGATVRHGQQVRTTDANGFFSFETAPSNANGTIIECAAPGYFDLTKTVIPIANGRTSMEIKLSPRNLSGTISASTGGTVNVGAAQVVLPAGGIISANGQAYTGTVNVYGVFLDPQSADMNQRMPGNLTAIRENGGSAVLATFGMIGVELETPSGAALNIAPGFEAEIHIPLGGDFLSKAPATIPLWHFDDQRGRWIEDGEATLTGNKYVGKVSHFSFWNCDVPFDAITLSGSVVNPGGNPIGGLWVRATVVSGGEFPAGSMAMAITNVDGQFSGKVPGSTVLLLELLNSCGIVLSSQQIGPYNSDYTLSPITLDLSSGSIEVQATVVDCSGNPVDQGYLKVEIGSQLMFLPTNSDGTVAIVILTCGQTSLIATPFDIENVKQGEAVTHDITGLSTLDLGSIEACDELQEYVGFSLDGVDGLIIDINAGIQQSAIYINGYGPDSVWIEMSLPEITAGNSVSPNYLSVSSFDPGTNQFAFGGCQSCGTVTVTITELGNVGELIRGSFTGTVNENNNPLSPMIPITGTFKVIRDY
jgi:hypothetical protein